MLMDAAFIEITNRCNLNCRFCYNSSGHSKAHKQMDIHTITQLIYKLSIIGVKSIALSGGEPLMHTAWEDILKLVSGYPLIHFAVISNGTIFNKKLTELCKNIPNLHMQISLDGADEQSNAFIRGAGNFTKTVETIKAFSGSLNKPVIKMVISRLNKKEIRNFVELIISLGAIPEFAFVSKQGNAIEDWTDIALEDEEKMSILKEIILLRDEYGFKVQLPLCVTGCPLGDESLPVNILIKTNGSIQPCQTLYDEKFCIGNIDDFSLDTIFKNFTFIKELAIQRSNTSYNCPRCMNRSTCNKGCMAEAFNNYGDCLANDGNCKMRIFQTVRLGIINHIQ